MNAQATLAPELPQDASHSDSFRSAMRHLAGGVSVITTGEGSMRSGLTVTSVSSLSMDPPALLVCINRNSSTLPLLRGNGSFGVNFLAAGHRELADRFAGRGGGFGAQRFHGARWIELVTGAPLLDDALAAIDCSVDTIMDWHTHALVIGRVEAVHVSGGEQALAYWRGEYAAV